MICKMESASRRIAHLASVLSANTETQDILSTNPTAAAGPKSDDDVVIVAYVQNKNNSLTI
jgi:hypothetical protein